MATDLGQERTDGTLQVIDRFVDDYYFLSNFYPCEIVLDGLNYGSVEQAYQASKTLDQGLRQHIRRLTAGEAKRYGQLIQWRPDWNEELKVRMMMGLVAFKFTNHKNLGERLLATGDALLIEGNTWADLYWGQVAGMGNNKLGIILMAARAVLFNHRAMKAQLQLQP